MNSQSSLLLPPRELSGLIFAGIIRDTRNAKLSDMDRLNFFPASPLVCLTYVVEGELRMIPGNADLEALRLAPAMAAAIMVPPQETPTVSWSPAAVYAVSVGVYPDAWAQIADQARIKLALETAFSRNGEAKACWSGFCSAIQSHLHAQAANHFAEPTAIASMAQWARVLVTRAALTGRGFGVRAVERRLKRWSGHSRRQLDFYAALENLHRLSIVASASPLADLAVDAGFADQSHMGRATRRGTGFSPARLNELIATREAFWCYRLLGERF